MGKTALVLGGGGAKGSYQMGVWRALRELNLSFDMVIGTSIGAINGALMAQGEYETANEIWNNIEYQNLFPQERENDLKTINNAADLIRFAINDAIPKGSVDCAALDALVQKFTDEDKIRAAKTDFGLVTVEISSLKPLELMKNDIPNGKLKSYIMASSACFPVFSPYEIDGAYYLDGGYYDNVPVGFAIKRGATDIVAVDLDGIGVLKLPPRLTGITLKKIHSHWDLGAIFDFDRSLFERNRILGYHDTLKAFERLDGFYYTFKKGESAKNAEALPAWQEKFCELIALLGKKPLSRAIGAIERKDDTIRALQKAGKSGDMPTMLCRSAETAGELFALPCQPLYAFREFNEGLLRAYNRQEEENAATTGRAVNAISAQLMKHTESEDAVEVLKTLSDMTKGEPSRSICALAVRLLQKEGGDRRLSEALCSLAPKEFAAAAYICLLLKNCDLKKDKGKNA